MTRLMDRPDALRKHHGRDMPLIGGLALIVPCLAVATLFHTLIAPIPFVTVAITATALTLALGLADDRIGLTPVRRLLVLSAIIVGASLLEPSFVLDELRLGGRDDPAMLRLGWFAIPITTIIILGFVNATNMADGMNGQLLGSVVIWSAFISLHLGFVPGFVFLTLLVSAAITLVFNLNGKLFTGNSGAYAVAVLVGFGAIAAYRRANGAMPVDFPLYWFWLPVLDCLRMIVVRTKAGRSPFSADRNHFHHLLQNRMHDGYALALYLGLLALPGLTAEIHHSLGGVTLLASIGFYAWLVQHCRDETAVPRVLRLPVLPDLRTVHALDSNTAVTQRQAENTDAA